MIDLFGLKKDAEGAEAPPADMPAKSRNKLWGVLLVVDSIFVIVFGGAVAAKVYHHWKAPAAPRPPAARAKTPPPAPKAPEAPKAEAPKPEAAKAEPKPAAKAPAPPKAEGPKSARPSLVAEPPKARPAAAPQAAAPQPPSPAGAKALAVDFRLRNPKARSVQLVGAFLVRGGGRKEMVRREGGVWTLTLYLKPDTYRYHFLVDGKKALDPDNPKVDRGASVISVAAP